MIFTAHHILMDGWSLAVLLHRDARRVPGGRIARAGCRRRGPTATTSSGSPSRTPTATVAKWTEYLSGVSGPLMVADGVTAAGDGVRRRPNCVLPADDTARLRNWAGRHGLTLNTAVLFAWAVVLSRLTDRRDVVFGTIVSGRPRATGRRGEHGRAVHQQRAGRARRQRSASVVDQCARLQRETSAMRDIGYLSLSEIQRAHGRGTLFDSMFVFENAPVDDAIQTVTTPDGASFTPVEMESLTHYPLTVVAHLRDDALVVLVEAIPEALPHLSPAAICERLVGVLRATARYR